MGVHPFVICWLIFAGPLWAAIGAGWLSRVYHRKGLERASARFVGGLGGGAFGPVFLVPVHFLTPDLRKWQWKAGTGAALVLELFLLFALLQPQNLCVTNANYVVNQILNGLSIGFIYALMGVGLTLIYSVQGIVNFAHGQFYMLGGYISYYFLNSVGDVNPLLGIPIAGLFTAILGGLFERLFLRPMHLGRVERPSEYAILMTFGFGFLLEYTTLGVVGPFPKMVTQPYVNLPRLEIFHFLILPNRWVAGCVGVVLFLALIYFLYRTWWGKALRAVSMNKMAASIAGINPLSMNTAAFSIGTLLVGMAGAALIPIFSWVPGVGAKASTRCYVVTVLGGLGSVPGALLGGLILGVVEALGAGCYPDPTKGAAYRDVFGLIVFALVLLLKPTGLFGRKV